MTGIRTGKHPDKALTAVQVRTLKKPGRYGDGNGLYLVVDPSGARRWLLRTVVHGRRRDLGLGSVRLVSLAEAREFAAKYRRIARNGGDPLVELRAGKTAGLTFEAAAERVFAEHSAAWKNDKHRSQWINTLRQYVFPVFGKVAVDRVETADVLRALGPIWVTKPETARRVRQRIKAVLDWAKAAGYREGDNPVDGVLKGLPRQPDVREHHAALPYAEVPAFVQRLRESGIGEIPKLAFELMILTACRTNEVLAARWEEVDLDQAVWTIPASRMKAKRAHRVPLAPRVLQILELARDYAGTSELVFPGRAPDHPLSNMIFLMTLRRMGLDVTAHGFRSSFRDWASEQTMFPREVCEAALAHTVKDKAEAAYARSDLFEKRRQLMAQWADMATAV